MYVVYIVSMGIQTQLYFFLSFCAGTKFAVDAFQYGLVEGITTYFLTHFHSDHYGGLKKSSTFHIYCNRVRALPN